MSELPELYEKLYFHEIDARERLNARLQMPLSLIIALAGVLAYLLQSFDFAFASAAAYFFAALLTLTAIALLCGGFHFVRAAWGQDYLFLPYAQETADHWNDLKKYDERYGTSVSRQLLSEYVERYFVAGATANAKSNDFRSLQLHKTSKYLIATSVLALLAFVTFVSGDLGRKSGPTQVLLAEPVEVRGITIPEKFVVVPADQQVAHDTQAQGQAAALSDRAGVVNDQKGPTPSAATAIPAADAAAQGRRSNRATPAVAPTAEDSK
jgi:hypothetical protein